MDYAISGSDERLIKKLVPDMQVNSIYDIDLDALWKAGIQGVITDLDNTLVNAKAPQATPKLLEWLKGLEERGFKTVIVSNNSQARVARFAEPLGLPYIYRAKKPTNASFRSALATMGLKAAQTAVIGDQMLTDVLGGNRMGLHTILVTPIALEEEGFFTRFNRKVEKRAKAWLRRRGLL